MIVVLVGSVIVVGVSLSLINNAKGPSKSRRLGDQLYGLAGAVADMIGAFRLAHPDSAWARRFYGPRKMRRARTRFAGLELAHEPETFIDRQNTWFARRRRLTLVGSTLGAVACLAFPVWVVLDPASFFDGTNDGKAVIALVAAPVLAVVCGIRSYRGIRELLGR